MTEASSSDVVIKFDGVSKIFRRDSHDLRAVDDVTLEIYNGEMVALLGTTGCGKSTLFNMVAGLIDPTAGKVLVAGRDPFREFDWFRGKMAVVFQNDRLLPWRTVRQNIQLVAEDMSNAELERLASAVGIADMLPRYPQELSLGLARRVALARALVGMAKTVDAAPTNSSSSRRLA